MLVSNDPSGTLAIRESEVALCFFDVAKEKRISPCCFETDSTLLAPQVVQRPEEFV
jgi:hypothetical protein